MSSPSHEPMDSLKAFFADLLEYNRKSNETFIQQLYSHEKQLSERSITLINHIINAHHIWNHRIEKRELGFGVWEIHKFEDLKRLNNDNCQYSFDLLNDYSLSQLIEYTNTQNLRFSNRIQDVFFHIINHSNYHRAQLANELKSLGITPPKSDYIVYKR